MYFMSVFVRVGIDFKEWKTSRKFIRIPNGK